MQRLYYLIIVLVAISTLHCQKEISFTNPGFPGSNPNPITATVQGNVVDENDNPATGVTIKIGAKTAITDAKGYFRIRNASLDKFVSLVSAEKPGYFKTFRVFSASSVVNQVQIKLVRKTLAGSLNSTSGGEITINGGSKIIFNANSFVDASGFAYSGTVNIYAAYIDPTAADIGHTVPGSFLADDKNGKRVILSSFGMMSVVLESATGEKLLLRSGHQAKLSFAIPSTLLASAPASIALWYVDEQSGLWKEEGTAVKNGNNYEGFVSHFTYWNCDVPGPTVNLTATFVNQDALPLVYTEIRIRPVSGYSSAHGCTDSLGQINGPVPANINLVLEVMSPCYTVIYSQNIGPFSSDVNLGTITVNNQQSIVSVEGTLLKCNGSPVTDGYAMIMYNNVVRYASVYGAGNFSTSFVTCGGLPPVCSIIGVDSLAGQQSPLVTVPVTAPVTYAGNITACGTSTLQFIDYILDGVPTNLSSLNPNDGFRAADSSGANHIVMIWGYRNGPANIFFDFMTNGSPGTFPLSYINVMQINSAFVPPSDVIITNHAIVVGDFFEGSFSGQFKDAQNNNHTISGTFRVRKL